MPVVSSPFLFYDHLRMMNETSSPAPTWADSFLPAADRVLYPLTLGITAVVWSFQLFEFFKGGAYRPQHFFTEGYLAVLAAYGAQRETAKWMGVEATSILLRRGELYVGLWVATWLFMTATANLHPDFAMPVELLKIVMGVLGIFAATTVSSGLRSRKARAKIDLRQAILDLFKQRKDLSAQEAANVLGISRAGAWKQLETLVKDGIAAQQDSNNLRERRYSLSK